MSACNLTNVVQEILRFDVMVKEYVWGDFQGVVNVYFGNPRTHMSVASTSPCVARTKVIKRIRVQTCNPQSHRYPKNIAIGSPWGTSWGLPRLHLAKGMCKHHRRCKGALSHTTATAGHFRWLHGTKLLRTAPFWGKGNFHLLFCFAPRRHDRDTDVNIENG